MIKNKKIIQIFITILILVCSLNELSSQPSNAKLDNITLNQENFKNLAKKNSTDLIKIKQPLQNLHYLVSGSNKDFLEIQESNNALLLKLRNEKGEINWEQNVNLLGSGFDVKLSDNSERIVVYEYEEGRKWINRILNGSGEIIKDNIPYLRMSNKGNFFSPEYNRQLELYDSNIDSLNIDYLINELNINYEIYRYQINYDFFDEDIIKIEFTEFEKGIARKRVKDKAARSVIALVNLIDKKIIYKTENDTTALNIKLIREFFYHNNVVILAYTNHYTSGNILMEAIDLITGKKTDISTGPYVQIGISKISNSFFVAQREKGSSVLDVKLFDIDSKSVREVQINHFRKIENIFEQDAKLYVQARSQQIRFWSTVEEIDSQGDLGIKYDGWLNSNNLGLVPISKNELFFKKK